MTPGHSVHQAVFYGRKLGATLWPHSQLPAHRAKQQQGDQPIARQGASCYYPNPVTPPPLSPGLFLPSVPWPRWHPRGAWPTSCWGCGTHRVSPPPAGQSPACYAPAASPLVPDTRYTNPTLSRYKLEGTIDSKLSHFCGLPAETTTWNSSQCCEGFPVTSREWVMRGVESDI